MKVERKGKDGTVEMEFADAVRQIMNLTGLDSFMVSLILRRGDPIDPPDYVWRKK